MKHWILNGLPEFAVLPTGTVFPKRSKTVSVLLRGHSGSRNWRKIVQKIEKYFFVCYNKEDFNRKGQYYYEENSYFYAGGTLLRRSGFTLCR